ncbi:hypothetical protein [Parageobacillus thermoglucosidasius]|uniref:Uncharacterized protein n=1 Tax=Parageobacillus thermoglucosidasius TaxID=1426 RepID=A0A1B7KXB7_PARTM|nr:hypothetical protein [Parageobacillus thermoglucosidasius]OAT74637.1 hypothetical protein A7K69_02685 [Parageobacillus thermoglucosidasius]
MKKHLYKVSMRGNESSPSATFGQLKYLIRESEVDKIINENFPLSDFNSKEKLLIHGSAELLKCFEKVDEEKLDIVEKLGNIEYIGISDQHEIILRFKDEKSGDLIATGIYDFTYDFLDDVFHMGKFSRFCISNRHYDILKENINELIKKMPLIERQYRLLKNNDKWFLRGITSTRYNNYDNHLALYLTFISLHRYAKQNKTFFIVEEAFLTDSELRVFFRQNEPIEIPKVGKIYFGAYVSNNEIKEGTFSLELRYTIQNESGRRFSGISDFVFNLNHATGVNNIKEKLSYSEKINELKEITLEHIRSIKIAEKLTENQIYLIFSKILSSTQKLSKETREKAKEYRIKNVINNTMSIIDAFDKLSDITTDIDERLYLERIYHEVINSLSS